MPRGSQQAGPVAGADAGLLVPRLLCPSRPLVCCQEPVTERPEASRGSGHLCARVRVCPWGGAVGAPAVGVLHSPLLEVGFWLSSGANDFNYKHLL